MSIYKTIIPEGTRIKKEGVPYIRRSGEWVLDTEQNMFQQMSEETAKDINKKILKELVKNIKTEWDFTKRQSLIKKES